jgi:hypothetical protein
MAREEHLPGGARHDQGVTNTQAHLVSGVAGPHTAQVRLFHMILPRTHPAPLNNVLPSIFGPVSWLSSILH